MNEPLKELKDRLKNGLDARNMKAVELSEKTRIPKSAISQYLSGYAKPKQDRIYLISKALNVDPGWLMGFDVPMEPKIYGAMTNYELASLSNKIRDDPDAQKLMQIYFNKLDGVNRKRILDLAEALGSC